MEKKHRIYTVPFAHVYPYYVKKVKSKGRTEEELHKVIRWLTGYTVKQLEAHMKKQTDFENFYGKAKLNPARKLITGTVCGVRVETIKDPLMQELRYLDKLIDELAKGKPMEKILRTADSQKET